MKKQKPYLAPDFNRSGPDVQGQLIQIGITVDGKPIMGFPGQTTRNILLPDGKSFDVRACGTTPEGMTLYDYVAARPRFWGEFRKEEALDLVGRYVQVKKSFESYKQQVQNSHTNAHCK